MHNTNLYVQASELAAQYQDWKAGLGKENQVLTWEQYCEVENELDLAVVNIFWRTLNDEYEGLDEHAIRTIDVSHLKSQLLSEAYSD